MAPLGALGNLRVVECGENVSAPFCARLLADAGAEVLKVEKPGAGDPSRCHGPFPRDLPHPERSGLYLAMNYNKLGVTLNVETPTGRSLLLRLLQEADLFIENTPGSHMEHLGLDYETLHGQFPRLIYVSLLPYGCTGPYKDYRGYDISSASLGGATEQIGKRPREPLAPPFYQSGHQAGLAGASAALVAVLARQASGQGQLVDIAEADAWATTHTGMEYMAYEVDGVPTMRARARAERAASGWPPPYWRTKDGIMVGGGAQAAQFLRFLQAIGKPEWVTDPRFQSRRELPPDAVEELRAVALPWFASRTSEEALEILFEFKIPITPVLTMGDLVNSPQEAARGFFQEIDREEVGTLKYPMESYILSKTPTKLRRPAPLLGQHNEEVFCGRLGYSRKDLVLLYQAGIV